ncbi:thermonuclease family protein [Patescibacteria group bacterium]|nr:thermonuclease family protein [Patescibacteria group bacterium]MBU4274439.1 thermonuclease family protein [Patescibacteria group bacterium]MBU4368045.1 thermonuclease family protein [Patescibacteria group bacterium]MBU4462216.1 thermonuclease family protein [Patescibacteria group bacterium]MCG2699572.1 thermonuclease family protein [Candidatus Parcubacteria bacterium]
MKKFFEKNKIFLAIVVGALIIGGAIYLSSINRGEVAEKSPATGENCQNIPELPDNTLKLATKIIDGDTFLIEGGASVRILGIDADERGYPCYDAAKNKLEELILNKEVKLEKGPENIDQYCRYLRYVISDGQNISLELVKEGMAVARFSPEGTKYREEITQAEKEAKENKVGCKWSASIVPDSGVMENKEFQWEKLTPELTGLKVIGACSAGNYYGREVIVEGKIADAYCSKTNTVFLNFEKPYPNHCFVGVIFSSDQYKFVQNPENYYSNKNVRIRGEIKEYQGKPEIILNDPSQIEIGK